MAGWPETRLPSTGSSTPGGKSGCIISGRHATGSDLKPERKCSRRGICLGLAPAARGLSEARSQSVLHLGFGSSGRLLILTRAMELDCSGLPPLREQITLVIAKHPMPMNALVLMSFIPQAKCVVNDSYCDNLSLSRSVETPDSMPNRRGSQLASDERSHIGRSAPMSPEDTRSPRCGLGIFGPRRRSHRHSQWRRQAVGDDDLRAG